MIASWLIRMVFQLSSSLHHYGDAPPPHFWIAVTFKVGFLEIEPFWLAQDRFNQGAHFICWNNCLCLQSSISDATKRHELASKLISIWRFSLSKPKTYLVLTIIFLIASSPSFCLLYFVHNNSTVWYRSQSQCQHQWKVIITTWRNVDDGSTEDESEDGD